jgi:hypothetical protein
MQVQKVMILVSTNIVKIMLYFFSWQKGTKEFEKSNFWRDGTTEQYSFVLLCETGG